MPLKGGAADKFGNRYEGRWTIDQMLRIVAERARSIWLEPVGDEGDGVEFRLTNADGVYEYHQVKRQRSKGVWTLTALDRERILPRFAQKLERSEDARCVFVSMESAQELRELAERARSAHDALVFSDEFVKDQENKRRLDTLLGIWRCPVDIAYGWLRRIEVRGIDEISLRERIEDRAGWLFVADEQTVTARLAQLALDLPHHELDAIAIVNALSASGIRRRQWNEEPHLMPRMQALTDSYARRVLERSILGKSIPRPCATQVLDRLSEPSVERAVVLTGGAGAGKSGVLAQVLEQARARGWAVLALRMDRPYAAKSARQLGQELDLPGSPVRVLAGVFSERQCLLLLDQLDAVSLVSGRQPDLFTCVDEMLRQADMEEIRGRVRVVMSCRTFDLDNDSRLRRLTMGVNPRVARMAINGLPRDTVDKCLRDCGLSDETLTDGQYEFLSTPLHLQLVTELVNTHGILELDTLESLYGRYWRCKQDAVNRRLSGPERWSDIIDRVVECMTENQALSVREEHVRDDFPKEVDALVSEGVFVQELSPRGSTRIAFLHETFFDYAFARRFVGRGMRLPAFLRAGEQRLFVRAPTRQVLTYGRHSDGRDYRIYLEDLREILTGDNIRFHVVEAVLNWLRQLDDPTMNEWNIVRDCLAHEDRTRAWHAWRAICARPWFELLDRCGFIAEQLSCGDPDREEYMTWYLTQMVTSCPKRVCDFALDFAEREDPWPEHACGILRWAELETHHGFVALYRQLLKRGALPPNRNPLDSSNSSSESILFSHALDEKQPAWALELFDAWLEYWSKHVEVTDGVDPFGQSEAWRATRGYIERLAAYDPEAFVSRILPRVLDLVSRCARRDRPAPYPDSVWSSWLHGDCFDLQCELRTGLDGALRTLSRERPEVFQEHANTLHAHLLFQTSGMLLARAYTANGETFADPAAAFLLSNRAWLELGWLSRNDSSNWISRELLAAITPHCSETNYLALENYVLAHEPEREWGGARYVGRAQHALLPGFHKDRRTETLRRRLGELQRKFGEAAKPPQPIRATLVGPPVQANWSALDDQNWLNLLAKYRSKELTTRDGSLTGGAVQLSRVLHDEVKRAPERFARLILKFPDDTNPYCFDAVLRGIADAPSMNPALRWDAFRRCHKVDERPCGRSMAEVLSKQADADVPDDILDIAVWYATESPDPDPGRGLEETTEHDRLENVGLNSIRGSMVQAFAILLGQRPEVLDRLRPHLQTMVRDPSLAVRTMVARALMLVLNRDRDLAVERFIELCQTDNDILLQSDTVAGFMHYACYSHLSTLLPIIDRMLASHDDRVTSQGARLVVRFALRDWDPLGAHVNQCLGGTVSMRLAAAEVAAANLTQAVHRDRCEFLLTRLFDDRDEEVRRSAAFCFRYLEGTQVLTGYRSLIRHFLDSRSFPGMAQHLFFAMNKCDDEILDLVCEVFERAIAWLRDTSARGESPVNPFDYHSDLLLLRPYKSPSIELQTRALALIDDMLFHRLAYHLPRELDEVR